MQSRKKATRKSAPARKSKRAGKATKSITARELKGAFEYIEGPIHMILLGVERLPDKKVIKRKPKRGGIFDHLRRLEALEQSNRVSARRPKGRVPSGRTGLPPVPGAPSGGIPMNYDPTGPIPGGPVPLPEDPKCRGLLGGPPLHAGMNAADVGDALRIIESWIAECRSVIGRLGRNYAM